MGAPILCLLKEPDMPMRIEPPPAPLTDGTCCTRDMHPHEVRSRAYGRAGAPPPIGPITPENKRTPTSTRTVSSGGKKGQGDEEEDLGKGAGGSEMDATSVTKLEMGEWKG